MGTEPQAGQFSPITQLVNVSCSAGVITGEQKRRSEANRLAAEWIRAEKANQNQAAIPQGATKAPSHPQPSNGIASHTPAQKSLFSVPPGTATGETAQPRKPALTEAQIRQIEAKRLAALARKEARSAAQSQGHAQQFLSPIQILSTGHLDSGSTASFTQQHGSYYQDHHGRGFIINFTACTRQESCVSSPPPPRQTTQVQQPSASNSQRASQPIVITFELCSAQEFTATAVSASGAAFSAQDASQVLCEVLSALGMHPLRWEGGLYDEYLEKLRRQKEESLPGVPLGVQQPWRGATPVFHLRDHGSLFQELSAVPVVREVVKIPHSTVTALRIFWAPPKKKATPSKAGSSEKATRQKTTERLGSTFSLKPCIQSSAKTDKVQTTPNKDENHSGERVVDSAAPVKTGHVTSDEVARLEQNLPAKLKEALLPFQWEGVRYGLRRGARCLLADEMGVGKTCQAIAIAVCYQSEWPLLVVVPASMRLPWAEELERWLTFLSPRCVHLVFGSGNDVPETGPCPSVVVTSYNMLGRLRNKGLGRRSWQVVIVDESHCIRTPKKKEETDEAATVIRIVKSAKRAIMLSGTPSLTRPFDIFNQVDALWPGLLGCNKYRFADRYCAVEERQRGDFTYKDYSKGARLKELNILLRETVMIRRLKEQVLQQLPPKRRQVILLMLEQSDCKEGIHLAEQALKLKAKQKAESLQTETSAEEDAEPRAHGKQGLSHHQLGLAKLRGVKEWLRESGLKEDEDVPKMILFAHHLEVLNQLQRYLTQEHVSFVRVDGSTSSTDRQKAVKDFRGDESVRVALVGVTAGGVGLDFSSAQTVVFAELPPSAADLIQAEARAHRRGQKGAVNVYIFCAKETDDDARWQVLSASLERTSTVTDGAEGAKPGIEVDVLEDRTKSSEGPKHMHLGGSAESERARSFESAAPPEAESAVKAEDDESAVYDDDFGIPIGSLQFEVSAHTGRIHLYAPFPGTSIDSSPEPLCVNLHPEDLPFPSKLPPILSHSSGHREEATQFWNEWSALRAVYRSRLMSLKRPLKVPLEEELEKWREARGPSFVPGGTTRRFVPREEVGQALPAGAFSREVQWRGPCGDLRAEKQGFSEAGEPLCKLCQAVCRGPHARFPLCLLHLFCQVSCYEEFQYRTSRSFNRRQLFALEQGVCTECNLDCHQLAERLKPLEVPERRAYVLSVAPAFARCQARLEILVKDPCEGNAWHADHIKAVFEGGGQCDVENLRTLCIPCHAKVTAQQAKRRAEDRKQRAEGARLTKGKKKGKGKAKEKCSGPTIAKLFAAKLCSQTGPPLVCLSSSGSEDDKCQLPATGPAWCETATEARCEQASETTCRKASDAARCQQEATCQQASDLESARCKGGTVLPVDDDGAARCHTVDGDRCQHISGVIGDGMGVEVNKCDNVGCNEAKVDVFAFDDSDSDRTIEWKDPVLESKQPKDRDATREVVAKKRAKGKSRVGSGQRPPGTKGRNGAERKPAPRGRRKQNLVAVTSLQEHDPAREGHARKEPRPKKPKSGP